MNSSIKEGEITKSQLEELDKIRNQIDALPEYFRERVGDNEQEGSRAEEWIRIRNVSRPKVYRGLDELAVELSSLMYIVINLKTEVKEVMLFRENT